jgi:hypothetical protein
MVDPSSAPRSCRSEKRTSVRPHFSHVSFMVAWVVISEALSWATSERFARREEG